MDMLTVLLILVLINGFFISTESFSAGIPSAKLLKTNAVLICPGSRSVRLKATQNDEVNNITKQLPVNPASNDKTLLTPQAKLRKRWITGLSLGAIGTLWICSGNGPFTFGFLLTSLIAQNEYYTMVKATGVIPAYKTGIITSLICYITAAMFPIYHEMVMPLSATILMIWLLIFKKKSALISEISTSLLGMFFLGYIPSFWVRLHGLSYLNSLQKINAIAPKAFGPISFGPCVTWWTWTSIVFADVGAYFIGKNFGKHKLATISSAAGSASPNKTVEGALAGFISCTSFTLLGAYIMEWPRWMFTGSIYGLMISFLALVGDLSVSMMKRDAKIKDSGNLLPGHGGLLDRIDSYLFTAPAAYFFCRYVLQPFMKAT
mmetsp:Transcript_31917/g.45948  ORF Transcript_31917/g.45948 Transcript_31917/m.45948 type:complete len:376 (-) Transcript_31917:772-1899(-)